MEEYLKTVLMSLVSNPEGISEIMGEYKPFVYKVCSELFGIYKDYIDNEEVYTYSAKALANRYRSYIDAGFTEDQAFTLLLNMNERNSRALNEMTKSANAKVNKD